MPILTSGDSFIEYPNFSIDFIYPNRVPNFVFMFVSQRS